MHTIIFIHYANEHKYCFSIVISYLSSNSMCKDDFIPYVVHKIELLQLCHLTL